MIKHIRITATFSKGISRKGHSMRLATSNSPLDFKSIIAREAVQHRIAWHYNFARVFDIFTSTVM